MVSYYFLAYILIGMTFAYIAYSIDLYKHMKKDLDKEFVIDFDFLFIVFLGWPALSIIYLLEISGFILSKITKKAISFLLKNQK